MAGETNDSTPPLSEEVLAGVLRMRERSIAFCYSILRDFQAAEDAYQEAALVAHRRLSQYSSGSFENWFMTILRNILGTRIRSSRRNPILTDSILIDRMEKVAMEESERPLEEENVDYVAECVEKLRRPLRKVLQWRFVDGVSCVEVARHLGRSVQATYAIIKRTRQALRECVEVRARTARGQG